MEQIRWQTAILSIPLPIYTINLCPSTRHVLTFRSIYKLLLDFLSRQSIKQAHNSSFVPTIRCDITLSIPLPFNIQTHILHVYPQFPSNYSSKYPRYSICSIWDETECCRFWLLLAEIRFNTWPLSNFTEVVDQPCHYSETDFSASVCKI